MEVDDPDLHNNQPNNPGTLTIVTPTNLIVSSVPLQQAKQRIIQTATSAVSGGGNQKLQVVKLISPGGQQALQGRPVSADTLRLVPTGAPLAGTKVQISGSPLPSMPNINQNNITGQRLLLPATSVSNQSQIVTIPVATSTTRFQSALATGGTVITTLATPSSESPKQVVAFLSPRKVTQHQPIRAKMVSPDISEASTFEVNQAMSAVTEPAKVKKEPAVIDDSKQKKPCNCTKSQCLKLYCDCFANGEFCGKNCNCNGCANNLENEELRQRAIKQCLIRNPQAFHPKIGKGESAAIRRHQKGCNCKRSGCLKNYCECFEARIPCGPMCKCVGCKNCDDNAISKSLMSLADAAMVRTMQQNSATDRLAEPLHNLVTVSDSSKTREAIKSHLKKPVIIGVLDCLLAQCREAEAAKCRPDTTEKVILEEFGRCLNKIIHSSTVNHKT